MDIILISIMEGNLEVQFSAVLTAGVSSLSVRADTVWRLIWKSFQPLQL